MTKLGLQSTLKSYFPQLNEDSLHLFAQDASILNVAKGTKLITEKKRHHYFYLIVEGSAKAYYFKDSKEICSWFAFENEILSSMKTFNEEPSNETIVLMEDSKLIQFNTKAIKALAATNIDVSQLIIDLITEHAVFLEYRLYQLQFMSSEERYEALIKTTPEVLQKVSLTDIASFLGISRETLSRIRAKK